MKLPLRLLYTASALGSGADESYRNLLARRAPGMREIAGDIPGRKIWFGSVTAELPQIADPHWNMRTNRLIELAIAGGVAEAAAAAIAKYGADRVGVVLGASNTGIDEAETLVEEWLGSGEKPRELDFSMIELGTPALYLAERLGVKGPAYTVSTACSSSAKAFAAAARLIESGACDAVVTGGVDSRCRFAMNGFQALGALAEGRSRPFAEDRDGINLGEGVALFFLGKDGESPVFLRGVGETSDAYHVTAPDPEGSGAESAMREALAAAGLEPGDIDYVNFHGTGTQANDAMEMKAFNRVFPDRGARPRNESTKDLTGHCLGAAGAIEAAISYLRIERGEAKTALSSSFAFGGSNAVVCLSA